MPDESIAKLVEQLLGGEEPTDRELLAASKVYNPPTIFARAIDLLVADGLERYVANGLVELAKARGEDLIPYAESLIRVRAEYRRKWPERVAS